MLDNTSDRFYNETYLHRNDWSDKLGYFKINDWAIKCRDGMKEQKISYSQLAEKLHCSKAHAWRILNQGANISLGEISQLDAIFNLRIMDYWSDEEYVPRI